MIREDLLKALKNKYNTERFEYTGTFVSEYKVHYLVFKVDVGHVVFEIKNENCFHIHEVTVSQYGVVKKLICYKLEFNGKKTVFTFWNDFNQVEEKHFEGRAFDFDTELVVMKLQGGK